MAGSNLETADKLRGIAKSYRRLVLLVGVQLIAAWFISSLRREAEMARLALFGLALVNTAFIIVAAYQLAEHLGRMPVVWAVLMLVPLLNLFGLFSLSSAAQTVCQRHGIRVGFLGPNPADLASLGVATPGHSTTAAVPAPAALPRANAAAGASSSAEAGTLLASAQELHFAKRFAEARVAYQDLVSRFPDSAQATVARQQVANLKGS
jgi:hypothetical protein